MLLSASALLLLAVDSAAAKKVCRHAQSGKYVSASYAKKYPAITVCHEQK